MHQRLQQFYFVLEGTAAVTVGETVEHLHPGEGVALPKGVLRQVRNASSEPLEFLVMSSGPPRGDRRDVL